MLPVKFLGNFYTLKSLPNAYKGFLFGYGSGHLWFLPALFWTIIAFTILKKICEKLKIDNPYVLLLIAGAISLLYKYIPVDVFKFKSGLSYIFWFALGYCFEYERVRNKPWSIKKTSLVLILLSIVIVVGRKFKLLNTFFYIITGSFLIYLLADICNRKFKNISNNKIWKIVIRNLFFVYLFHDPLEYIILRIFMNSNIMRSAIGCIMYGLSRTVGVFIVCIIIGEFVSFIKKKWME